MKRIGRIFRWLTLLSLLFWSGVAVALLMMQPVIKPPSDLPQSYAVCTGSYAMAVPYAEVQAEVKKRCADYFAALGDRGTPFYKRLYARLIGRIVSDMVSSYLKQYPPQPGQVIGGPQMLDKLGSEAIVKFAYTAVIEADQPPPAVQTRQLACFVRKARGSASVYDLQNLPTACPFQ